MLGRQARSAVAPRPQLGLGPELGRRFLAPRPNHQTVPNESEIALRGRQAHLRPVCGPAVPVVSGPERG